MSAVRAECFDYKADSLMNIETISNVKQTKTASTNGRVDKDNPQVRYPVWVGKTDYLAVQMAARFTPSIVVTEPGAGFPLTEGWQIDPVKGYQYAELNFGGNRAHSGSEGWVDIVFRAADAGAEGQFQAWIYTIESQPFATGSCDQKFVAFQGGSVCNSCEGGGTAPARPDCGGVFCATDQCCQLTFGVIGNCLPAKADAMGFCE